MGLKLPNDEAVLALLRPVCPDDQTLSFAQWFAARVSGQTFDSQSQLDVEIVSALDDYANEGNTTQAVVIHWYSAYAHTWMTALTDIDTG
jgi:hypothetical protein